MNEARWARVLVVVAVAIGLSAIRGTVADVRGLFADRRNGQEHLALGALGQQLGRRLTDSRCLASWPHDTSGPPARDSLRQGGP